MDPGFLDKLDTMLHTNPFKKLIVHSRHGAEHVCPARIG